MGAQEKKMSLSFENIFMSAADVDEDIFSSVDKEGANIVGMLEKNGSGKVYVFHNIGDLILRGSTNVVPGENIETSLDEIKDRIKDNLDVRTFPNLPLSRLGIRGAQNISKDFKGKVENKNAS